jgi:hypothetical protein
MRTITQALRWTGLKLRRLRGLVKDEDHDSWYDEHTAEHDKPPNLMGPGSQ